MSGAEDIPDVVLGGPPEFQRRLAEGLRLGLAWDEHGNPYWREDPWRSEPRWQPADQARHPMNGWELVRAMLVLTVAALVSALVIVLAFHHAGAR